mmetsp:Transcript_24580/g.50268  ORF Transcript_24580/g.50268 Transcript_24580/m.50268 type:complete len:162 (-) Transcript_24580:127-612(-)
MTRKCMTVNSLSPPPPPGNYRKVAFTSLTNPDPDLLTGKSLISHNTFEIARAQEVKTKASVHHLLSDDIPIPRMKNRLSLRRLSDEAARPRTLSLRCVADIPPPPFFMTATSQAEPPKASSPAEISRSQREFRNDKLFDADNNLVKLPASLKRCTLYSSCA